MSDPSAAVQKAIYETLAAALEAVSPKLADVYDHVPQGVDFPFVSIDAQEVVEADFLASNKSEHFVYLTVWSRYRGQKEVLGILSAIRDALHRTRFTLETGSLVSSTVIRSRTSLDADGVSYMGRATVKIITEH